MSVGAAGWQMAAAADGDWALGPVAPLRPDDWFGAHAARGLAERREIEVQTAFAGPGARDAFEMVTRAVTEGRYVVDDALVRPERGPTHERFVFRLGYRGRNVTVALRDGYVSTEFIALAGMEQRTAEQEDRLTVLKREMAELLLATPAAEVYDVDDKG